MSYPLIILGAGASHDYSIEGTLAPLTNELVKANHLDINLMNAYKGSGDVMSDIAGKVKNQSKTFEEALSAYKKTMTTSLTLQRQFVALEFYLQNFFRKISTVSTDSKEDLRIKHEINNYRVLLNHINRYCAEKACIVTFNYDTLLERNLKENIPADMKDYIRHNIKIIKLHGSHDWVYVNLRGSFPFRTEKTDESFKICYEHPSFLDKIKADGSEPEHVVMMSNYVGGAEYLKFPAIAVPLNEKDNYICPKSHISVLENELDLIDRILIIGWKAGDPALFDIIKRHPNYKKCKILVVSADLKSAEEVTGVIKNSLTTTFVESYNGNFSGFINSDSAESFFQ